MTDTTSGIDADNTPPKFVLEEAAGYGLKEYQFPGKGHVFRKGRRNATDWKQMIAWTKTGSDIHVRQGPGGFYPKHVCMRRNYDDARHGKDPPGSVEAASGDKEAVTGRCSCPGYMLLHCPHGKGRPATVNASVKCTCPSKEGNPVGRFKNSRELFGELILHTNNKYSVFAVQFSLKSPDGLKRNNNTTLPLTLYTADKKVFSYTVRKERDDAGQEYFEWDGETFEGHFEWDENSATTRIDPPVIDPPDRPLRADQPLPDNPPTTTAKKRHKPVMDDEGGKNKENIGTNTKKAKAKVDSSICLTCQETIPTQKMYRPAACADNCPCCFCTDCITKLVRGRTHSPLFGYAPDAQRDGPQEGFNYNTFFLEADPEQMKSTCPVCQCLYGYRFVGCTDRNSYMPRSPIAWIGERPLYNLPEVKQVEKILQGHLQVYLDCWHIATQILHSHTDPKKDLKSVLAWYRFQCNCKRKLYDDNAWLNTEWNGRPETKGHDEENVWEIPDIASFGEAPNPALEFELSEEKASELAIRLKKIQDARR